MNAIEKGKAWMERHPPTERIVDHKIMQSYCHEYPIIRDLLAEVEQLEEKCRQIVIGAEKLAQEARRHAAVECQNIVHGKYFSGTADPHTIRVIERDIKDRFGLAEAVRP